MSKNEKATEKSDKKASEITNNNPMPQQRIRSYRNPIQRQINIENQLVYNALRDQKKTELMMKVRELRHVTIKEKYFDALIRLYDINVGKYFHYNTETLPFTVLGIMLIFIGNIFINMSFTQNQVSIKMNVVP